MELLTQFVTYVVPFLVVLTILVFVHELGHYWVARRNGVRIEVFSIGFGSELFGWTDKAGTRWKFSAIPLGGYVKMYGDADATSAPGESLPDMTPEQRAVSFHHKSLGQRAAVVAAGPAANFLFAIVVFAALYVFVGQPFTPPNVGVVLPDSAAQRAGIQPDDRIVSINGGEIERFEDIQRIVQLNLDSGPLDIVVQRGGGEVEIHATPTIETARDRLGRESRQALLGIAPFTPPVVGAVVRGKPAERAGIQAGDRVLRINGTPITRFEDMLRIVEGNPEGTPLTILLDRDGREIEVRATPTMENTTDRLGREVRQPQLGIRSAGPLTEIRQHGPVEAVSRAVQETWGQTIGTLRAMGQIVTGRRSTSELGGPGRIAEMAGEVTKSGGAIALILFMCVLSINLGLINLFPVPMLDGGHLLFYAAEALRGRPLSLRVQEYGFRIGLVLVLSLMLFATWNDLVHLRVVQFFVNLVS
jgi:regulator of sigma E protease